MVVTVAVTLVSGSSGDHEEPAVGAADHLRGADGRCGAPVEVGSVIGDHGGETVGSGRGCADRRIEAPADLRGAGPRCRPVEIAVADRRTVTVAS